jgi:hypothetical protein
MSDKDSTARQHRSLECALEAVGAIGEAGLVVMPLEPTEAMLRGAARAAGVSREAARKAYRAFLAASQ